VRHELHLARAGFAALAAIAALAVTAGGVLAGRSAAASAALGVGIVAVNHAVAVASTAWARTVGPRVIAVGYSVFVVRMLLVLGTFGTLSQVTWVQDNVLAFSFCAALIASLTAECISYVKGSYVPAWRTR
jgi:hypothetical protein